MVCSGTCTDVTSDLRNCGSCGRACTGTQVCVAGNCMTVSTPQTAGQACVRDSDCGAGGGCVPNGSGFPGGYCVYLCPTGAMGGDTCADGTGICIPNGTQMICFHDCTPGGSGECRSGYICQSVTSDDSLGICYPNCAGNPGAVCGAYRCDTASGECTGSMCTSSTQCSTSSTCSSGSCVCTASTNCGAGRRCVGAGTSTAHCGCLSSSACAAGRSCDTTSGNCI